MSTYWALPNQPTHGLSRPRSGRKTSRFLWALFLLGSLYPLQANEILVGDSGGSPQDTVLVPLSVLSAESIVGLQLDLVYPSQQADGIAAMTSLGDPPAGSPKADHFVRARKISNGRTRVVLVSPTNTPLPPDSGLQLPLTLKTTAPFGGPDLKIENLRFITTSGKVIRPGVRFGPIASWKKQVFTAAERLNPLIVGDDRDPDGDRAPNLLEFSTGGNPKSGVDSDRSGGDGRFEADGENREWFRLRYRKAKNLDGATLVVEAGDNLNAWTEVPSLPTGNEDSATVELEAKILSADESRHFLRLRVKRLPVVPGADIK